MTETHRVRDLAGLVARLTGAPIEYLPNPRNEAPENDLIVEAKSLVELGLKPTCLERGLLEEVIDVAKKYGDRCDRRRIPCTSKWTSDRDIRTVAPSTAG
jgi:UDP-sulfoquinovose synthase